MEEANKPSHSMGSGHPHPRSASHPRPFFYVQPASQPSPYHPPSMYQWHMNNPYGQYGFSGAGIPFGRPYISPYSYMPYPGYMVPHAPVHPVDYRRMYEPHYPPHAAAAAYDLPFRHHYHHGNSGGARRDTACSGAQTDPSDALDKLMECLDKLRSAESAAASDRELDSGMASQTSGIFSPTSEGVREGGAGLEPGDDLLAGSPGGEKTRPRSPGATAALFSDSTAAVYDAESSRSRLEALARGGGGWSDSDGEPPLDTSSLQEESGAPQEEDEEEEEFPHHCHSEKHSAALDSQPDRPACSRDGRGREGVAADREEPAQPGTDTPSPPARLAAEGTGPGSTESTRLSQHQSEVVGAAGLLDLHSPYRILRLPFDKVLSAGVLQREAVPPLRSFPTPPSLGAHAPPYYLGYCPPPLAHERLSVLSPSLDELSSRDELFSTDLEDVSDLFPGHSVYVAGDDAVAADDDDVCPVCPAQRRSVTCAACGSSLNAACQPPAYHAAGCYDDEGGSEDDDRDDDEAVAAMGEELKDERGAARAGGVKKPLLLAPKKAHVPRGVRQPPKPKARRGGMGRAGREAERQAGAEVCAEHDCCGEHAAERGNPQDPRGGQTRACKERPWREAMVTPEQGYWESGGVRPKPKACKHQPLPQRTERQQTLRKSPCHPMGFQRPRTTDDPGDEGKGPLPRLHRGREMAGTSTQLPLGSGPQGPGAPQGAPPTPGPRHVAPGPYGAPHLEDQQHQRSRPFFYVQPSQPYMPYMPYQWPMPMSYNPYCGFPGMGYGMVMPPFPPSPYLEPPGYVLPHAQMHLMDYRRMLPPHLAPTVAYQARRFRYQHAGNAPQPPATARVMISSEAQTEPSPVSRAATLGTSDSGRGTGCGGSALSSSPNSSEDRVPELVVSTAMPQQKANVGVGGDATAEALGGRILFQAEEVRIECCGTPTGLKVVSQETTAELASVANGNLLQCSVGSVIRHYQASPTHEEAAAQSSEDRRSEEFQACPDLLMGGTAPSSVATESLPPSTEGSVVTETKALDTTDSKGGSSSVELGCTLVVQGDSKMADLDTELDDLCVTSAAKNVHFKILRLPFDMQYLDDLRQMEASVWSVESLLPYVPSADWLMQNGLLTPQKEPVLSPVLEVPLGPSGPPRLHAPPDEDPPAGPLVELETQDSATSLESLPPYLPSASWLADFGNVYYYSKLPLSNQQQLGIINDENDARGQMEVGQHVVTSTTVSPPTPRQNARRQQSRRPAGTTGVSDNEGFPSRPLPENVPSPTKNAGARVCNRCLSKRSVTTALLSGSSPTCRAPGVKRHRVATVPGCPIATCKCVPGGRKPPSKGSGSDINSLQNADGETTEGETSENSVHPAGGSRQRGVEGLKRHLDLRKLPSSSRHSEKCAMAQRSKLREQNCSCEEPTRLPHAPHSTPAWEGNGNGRGVHGDVTRERNEENLALSATERWRNTRDEQRCITQKRQAEKSWRTMPVSDTESTKSGSRPRNQNQHKKPYTQSQGNHRRDTRC